MDHRQLGVAEARGDLLDERHADFLQPVDRLAAFVGENAGHLGVLRAVPIGMAHEPVVYLICGDVDPLCLCELGSPAAEDTVAQRRIAADDVGLLEHDNACACVRCFNCSRKACAARAYDNHVGFLAPRFRALVV